jgi:hypothetical protein
MPGWTTSNVHPYCACPGGEQFEDALARKVQGTY